VLWQVRRFAGLNRRPDDITIVAVKVNELDRQTGTMIPVDVASTDSNAVEAMLADDSDDDTLVSIGEDKPDGVSTPNDATVVMESDADEESDGYVERLVEDEQRRPMDPTLSGHLSPDAHLELDDDNANDAGEDDDDDDDGFVDDLSSVDDPRT